jgi:peptidoglycan/xylan/chitin deacetylase (PgdA/CDA1 family)
MKNLVKRAVASRVGWTISAVARSRGCFVLTYHRVGTNPHDFKHVPADVFRDQMRFVRDRCLPIHPDDLRASVLATDRTRPPVLVTFDDGYLDYLEVAYPILREFGIPAINFISTHFTDTGDMFWWDEIDLAVAASTRARIELPWATGVTVTLDRGGRQTLRREARSQIKRRPHAEIPAIMNALTTALDVRRPLAAGRQVMTWSQIRSVQDVTIIGAHTHTHPLLTRIDRGQLQEEARTCRDRIAAELGHVPRLFAYPSGAFNGEAQAVLRDAGFDMAFSSIHGINDDKTDWMQIRRVYAPPTRDQLPFVLSGLWTQSKARRLAADQHGQ